MCINHFHVNEGQGWVGWAEHCACNELTKQNATNTTPPAHFHAVNKHLFTTNKQTNIFEHLQNVHHLHSVLLPKRCCCSADMLWCHTFYVLKGLIACVCALNYWRKRWGSAKLVFSERLLCSSTVTGTMKATIQNSHAANNRLAHSCLWVLQITCCMRRRKKDKHGSTKWL